MPRYYFDLTDGQDQYTDEDGEELRDDREARSCARAVLTDNVGRSCGADGEINVRVRDDNGVRFTAKLSISVE
jgi:hypothetical protein